MLWLLPSVLPLPRSLHKDRLVFIFFSSLFPFEANHLVKWSCNVVGSSQIELNVCAPAHTRILASIEMSRDGRKVKEILHSLV